MARAIAESLGVPVQMVPYAKPGELADDAEKDKWDIGLIGAEPARAEKIRQVLGFEAGEFEEGLPGF